jgi:hypothetical protein
MVACSESVAPVIKTQTISDSIQVFSCASRIDSPRVYHRLYAIRYDDTRANAGTTSQISVSE